MVRSPNAFDVSIQHIAGSNLKLTGCPSRNPVGEAMPKGNYNEEYVINILAEQADSNLKNGQLIGDQSKRKKGITERTKNNSEHIIEHNADQSQSNGMLENKNHVKETKQNEMTTSGQSDITTLKDSQPSKAENCDEMNRETFDHWGGTREVMDCIRKNNSLETRRQVEQRNALSRPATLRRRYDHQTQRTVFAPSRPNKRSRDEAAKIDSESIRRANRLGAIINR